MMIKLFFILTSFLLLTLSPNGWADSVHFKAPALVGKLIANNIELTDWQTSMSCHFNYKGQRKQSIRYPQTFITNHKGSSYTLKIKAGSLNESLLPHYDLVTCAYKLILIGKNITTHQLAYGEIVLLGKETGTMSDNELQSLQDINQVSKILNDRTKELVITTGKEGGIIEDTSNNNEQP